MFFLVLKMLKPKEWWWGTEDKDIINNKHSLRVGSPLSHTHEWQREKQSGGKNSGEEVPRKWACPDVCNFFISASPEQSEIPLVEKWERLENWQSIVFDEGN